MLTLVISKMAWKPQFVFGFNDISKTDLCDLKKSWGNVFQLLHF